MGYLTKNDYKSYIQTDYLRQLTQADPDKRLMSEKQAMQDIVQRLTQKYDLELEFTDTNPYQTATAYKAGARVTVEEATGGFQVWSSGTTYAEGDPVIYSGYGYFCVTANDDAEFVPDNWVQTGAEKAIYYAAWPPDCTIGGQPNPATLLEPYAPMFNYKNVYTKGDIVWWKNKTYTCNQASVNITHEYALQCQTISNIPYRNVFPDDAVLNQSGAYWANGTAYTVPAGTPLSDTSKWVAGDNRNQSIKSGMVVLSVFRLSPLIAPANRPQSWLEDFRDVLRDMNEAALGNMTMVLPPKQPQTGLKTRYGGNVKNQNSY